MGIAVESRWSCVEEIEGLVPKPPKEEQEPDDLNPFTALFDFKKDKTTNAGDGERNSTNSLAWATRADSDVEKAIRSQANLDARRRCLGFYERCKQALKMTCYRVFGGRVVQSSNRVPWRSLKCGPLYHRTARC